MKRLLLSTLWGVFFFPLQIFSHFTDVALMGLMDRPTYPVSEVLFTSQQDLPENLPIRQLQQIEISFYESEGVLYGGRASGPGYERLDLTIGDINSSGRVWQFSKSALEQLLHEVHSYFRSRGMNWVVVYIPNKEISKSGADLRSSGDTTFAIAISTPAVKGTSVKFVDPDNPSKEIDNPKLSKKICDNFPSSLPDPSSGYPGGFINSNALNNYLYALNRYPNRRVDLEIGPSGIPGQVDLNFVVTQKRPYHFYFNANNNVPKPIDRWEESVGFIHTQVSGNDDILKANASTDSFDKYYSVDISYEAPFRNSIGTRWQILGAYNRFASAEFALPQNLFTGIQAIANLEFITNIAQWGRLFLDFVADLQYRHISNEGHALFPSVSKNFLLPGIGFKLIQLKRETKLIASASLQSTMSSLFWDVGENLDSLGRLDLSTNWAIFQAGVYGSFYLESLFSKSNQPMQLANEIVIVAQLQNAFNQRLIPQLEGILGGLYSIRGYPQSTIAGDNLYMGSIEYRFHLPQALSASPDACTTFLSKSLRYAPAQPGGETDWDLIFRAFYDVGGVTINQRQPGESNFLIMGAGLGVELIMWQNVFIRGDWGHAFRSANGISSGNNEFYFSSTIIF